jgi:hypothetical protein
MALEKVIGEGANSAAEAMPPKVKNQNAKKPL